MADIADETNKTDGTEPGTVHVRRAIAFTSSSQIASIEYDETEMDLIVSFQRGGTYTYHQIPSDVANGFANAPSAGKYLNEFVKLIYDYEKVG